MSHRAAMVCGGAFLCAAIGCVPAFLTPHEARGYKYVSALPPGQVAAILEVGLGDAGMKQGPLKKTYGNETRVVGQAKSGKVFCIYLRGQPGVRETTTVSVHWDDGTDDGLWQTIVGLLEPYGSPPEESTPR
jgi:hypothetical protein